MLISWFLMLILHFLLPLPVKIPKIKINVIFIIVVNALPFDLCDFITKIIKGCSFNTYRQTQK